MEVVFSFLDLKITQNKESSSFHLFHHTKQYSGSLASRYSDQQEPAPLPSNKLPQIFGFGKTDAVCEFRLIGYLQQ